MWTAPTTANAGGVVEAKAIHALIRAAAASGKLRQVLLLGDDSLDPNDYLGLLEGEASGTRSRPARSSTSTSRASTAGRSH